MSRRAVVLMLAGAALVAAGCSDDDANGAGTTTTVTEPATTADATTSTPATTEPSTSPPTTATPTTVTPTTEQVDEEALKAEIARDYERAFYRGYEMVGTPSLRNLETRAATVVVPGSPAFEVFTRRIRELVALGDRVVPNEPDLLVVTVEGVKLVGHAPYRRAIVTACEVSNRKQVTPPENSSTGDQIEVAGSGQLLVFRFHEPVRLTENGWLRFKDPRDATQYVQGEPTCPPE